jgi:Nucleoporin Nup120/160
LFTLRRSHNTYYLLSLLIDDSSSGSLKISSILNSNSSSAKMTTATCGIIKNRIVSCIYWSSSQSVFFGLRGGDTLLAGLQDEGRGQGLSLIEYLLRDTAFLQVLWDGIMQTDNFERATLALCSVETGKKYNQSLASKTVRDNIVMAVSSEGVMRVWSTKSKKCVLQISLGQLLSDWLMFETLEGIKGYHVLKLSYYIFLCLQCFIFTA